MEAERQHEQESEQEGESKTEGKMNWWEIGQHTEGGIEEDSDTETQMEGHTYCTQRFGYGLVLKYAEQEVKTKIWQ